MKHLITAVLLCFSVAAVTAAEQTEKDAVAMVERGAAFAKAHGKDELMKRITAKDPEFVQGSLYIYVRDFNTGANIAHPFNQSLIGKNLDDVPDTNGKLYRRDIWEMAKKEGKGWVDYMYKNPANGKIESKTTYLLRVNDVVLIAGVYKK